MRVLPLTYDPNRFADLDTIYIDKDGELLKKVIEKAELSGKYINLQIQGIDSYEDRSLYTGCEVKIHLSQSPEPPEGTYYHYQILGLGVFTDKGRYIGKVKNILVTGSNDVYAVTDGEREVLIPAIEEVIKEINLKEERIIIRPVAGLLDDV